MHWYCVFSVSWVSEPTYRIRESLDQMDRERRVPAGPRVDGRAGRLPVS